ncbi:hypothetical protein MTDSW087_03539 [Methylobacterium dankookense]|jgi:hypothetical protein|uniref:Uncharacterized protein n=1 Tax=Methylobacterium dankookense TaxID=560405 RepID=A0A564G0T5_9HYPH|nr:hypothetical protein IFDJLNFL_1455 [Methylobacterium dankookense]VUF13832.1 hypothetical protein MTDSW087_03539 [Methylobacterium dankookense]
MADLAAALRSLMKPAPHDPGGANAETTAP